MPLIKGFAAELEQTEGVFFGGDKPGAGDLSLWHVVDNLSHLTTEVDQGMGAKWAAWRQAVAELEGVRQYLAERPEVGTGLIGKAGSLAFVGGKL